MSKWPSLNGSAEVKAQANKRKMISDSTDTE